MPIIKIFRKKGWTTRFKVIELYVDGQRIGYISNGESKEFEVPAGQHTLKAKMGWYGSKNFVCNLYNKEIKSFTVSPNSIFVTFFPIFIVCFAGLNVYLKGKFKFSDTLLKLFPGFIILLVGSFQIFGRNNYLIIKEGIDN